MKPTVIIGYPSGGHPHIRFVSSLTGLLWHEHAYPTEDYSLMCPPVSSYGTLVPSNRNRIVKYFLGMKADWLLQLDDDLEFRPDLLRNMMRDVDPVERPVLCGFYVNIRPETDDGFERSAMFHSYKKDEDAFSTFERVEPGKVFRVEGAGGGCLLVHRGVYEKLQARRPNADWPWFYHGTSANGRSTGEDLQFFTDLMDAGIPAWGTSRVHLRHWKSLPVAIDEWWNFPQGRGL